MMPIVNPPNVLLSGFHTPLNQQAVKQALDRTRIGKLGLISLDNFLETRADFFLSGSRGFRDCNFDRLEFDDFPSASLLRNLQPAEAVVLRMMERMARHTGCGHGFETRKRRYLEMVAYVFGLIRRWDFHTVILCNIPHFPFEYILHSVALALGRRAHFFNQIQPKDTFVVSSVVDGMFEPIRGAYNRMRETGTLPALSQRMRHEIQRRSVQHQPFYMTASGSPWWSRLYLWQKRATRVSPRGVLNGMRYLAARFRRGAPGLKENFVYFPLHLQPEASTSPMGGVFVDQCLAIELLVRALPSGWSLVIKENPKQLLAKREPQFYQRLRGIPNVKLVSRSASTFSLIQRSRAVATITGTAGWEALFMGKPVIVFGNAFYAGVAGTVTVDDVPALAGCLESISRGEFSVCTAPELERFLAAVEACSYQGVADSQYLQDSDIPEAASVEVYASALVELITAPDK